MVRENWGVSLKSGKAKDKTVWRMAVTPKSKDVFEIKVPVPEGMTLREFKRLAREAIIEYLIKEEGLSEEEVKKLKITVKMEEK